MDYIAEGFHSGSNVFVDEADTRQIEDSNNNKIASPLRFLGNGRPSRQRSWLDTEKYPSRWWGSGWWGQTRVTADEGDGQE